MQPSGRAAQRTAMHSAGRLEPIEDPSLLETIAIENISTYGARVLTSRQWSPHVRVIVSDLNGSFRASAEVVYCESAYDGLCAVGLKFDQPTLQLNVGANTHNAQHSYPR